MKFFPKRIDVIREMNGEMEGNFQAELEKINDPHMHAITRYLLLDDARSRLKQSNKARLKLLKLYVQARESRRINYKTTLVSAVTSGILYTPLSALVYAVAPVAPHLVGGMLIAAHLMRFALATVLAGAPSIWLSTKVGNLLLKKKSMRRRVQEPLKETFNLVRQNNARLRQMRNELEQTYPDELLEARQLIQQLKPHLQTRISVIYAAKAARQFDEDARKKAEIAQIHQGIQTPMQVGKRYDLKRR